MEPTLLEGERYVSILLGKSKEINRNDIVLFNNFDSVNPIDLKTSVVKRVIGVPGDYYGFNHMTKFYYLKGFPELGLCWEVIPNGFFFVSSDNGLEGYGSMQWGLIPESRIFARILRYQISDSLFSGLS